MSVQNARAAIQRFLSTDKPEVLCIRGEWGTGKTWTWDDVLKTQGQAGKVPLKRYAKASLFGLNSLAEIKREIFQSTVDVAQIDKPFDPANYKDLYAGVKSQSNLWLKAVDVFFDKGSDAIVEALALSARNMIICVDDLERKGEDLRSVDVLGYISQLAIDRKCKVVLLLNDAQLEDKVEFEGYLEKVVDVHLRFEPSHEEIAEIAIPGDADNIGNLIKGFAIKLGISNVRVIRKIFALCKLVTPLLKEYSFKVTINTVRTITLFGWSYFQPESAPSLEYLRKVNTYSAEKNDSDEQMRWRDTLLSIDFYSSNDFDDQLLTGIRNGYFAEAEIAQHARVLNQADIRGKADMEMRRAWNFYHNSFNRPADEALGEIYETYKRLNAYMSLNDTVQLERLFRELDDPRAMEFIDMYAAANADNPSAFDLDHLARFGEELTQEVQERLAAAQARQKPKMTPDELFLALAKRGFEEDVVVGTAALPVEEYTRALKSHEDEAFSDIINGLRQYLTVGNPNEYLHTILDKAAVALRQIAGESAINRRRAMRLGIIQRLDAREQAAAQAKVAAEIAAEVSPRPEIISITTIPASAPSDTPPPPAKKSRARRQSRNGRERQP